jgi:dihydroorotase
MHLHLREGAMQQTVTPLSAQAFAGAVIMPNLVPPVDNRERLERYRASIRAASVGMVFEPYMTLFLRAYSEAELAAARPLAGNAFKVPLARNVIVSTLLDLVEEQR